MTGPVVGFDTASAATAAAVLLPDGSVHERRDDPAEGARPAHASRLLELVLAAMADAGVRWPEVDRLAVGVGPGGFTGLRIGVATARGLAQAHGLPLCGVGSLEALAAGAAPLAGGRPVLAVLDARRGEAFTAAWQPAVPPRPEGPRLAVCLLEPRALGPAALAEEVAALPEAPLAVGDGALRFRDVVEGAGGRVAPEGPAHRISAAEVCRLAALGRVADREALLPDYRRDPDAKPRSPAR